MKFNFVPSYYAIFLLLAGLGVLLIGFKLLSDNIEKLAGAGLKKVFNKISRNPFVGVGIGAFTTAVIQSSAATTVMVVGFVNAGIMTLYQAAAVIFGANIGTTITAHIASLGSFDITTYAMVLACIGAFMNMLFKNKNVKSTGLAIAGLGMVFIGLKLMSGSMSSFTLPEWFTGSPFFNNPFVLLLFGILFTAVVQSSSAVTTIMISFAVSFPDAFANNPNAILFVILGSNIGTCVTALLSSIGTSPNAKRASLIHLMFNVFAGLIFFVLLFIWKDFNAVTFQTWFEGKPAVQIAMFHTFFNVTSTLIFLPFINVFVKISQWIIKDKKELPKTSFLDDRFLLQPSIAIDQVTKETVSFGKKSLGTLIESIDSFIAKDLKTEDKIRENMKDLEIVNQAIIDYLLKISACDISLQDEAYISALHKILIDFSRESEIADNMLKYNKKQVNESLVFSSSVIEGLTEFRNKLLDEMDLITAMFAKRSKATLKKADDLESEIDTLRSELINNHIKRLEDGKCSPSSNSVYINMISNLERAGDHLNYVAHSLYESRK